MNKQTKHWTMIYVITLLTPDAFLLPFAIDNYIIMEGFSLCIYVHVPFPQVYDKNQSRYMIHLLAGVAAIGTTVTALVQNVYWNTTPHHLLKN